MVLVSALEFLIVFSTQEEYKAQPVSFVSLVSTMLEEAVLNAQDAYYALSHFYVKHLVFLATLNSTMHASNINNTFCTPSYLYFSLLCWRCFDIIFILFSPINKFIFK